MRICFVCLGNICRSPTAHGVMQRLIDDAQLIDAMRAVHAHAGLVTEPAGVAGLAALLARTLDVAGQRIATVICGGNITAEQQRDYGIVAA